MCGECSWMRVGWVACMWRFGMVGGVGGCAGICCGKGCVLCCI